MKSRDKILQAAIPVFAGKGRHGAHMEEIAAHARINKAMIYYIFHSKDELYFEVLKHILTQAWHAFNPETYCNLNSRQDMIDDLIDLSPDDLTAWCVHKPEAAAEALLFLAVELMGEQQKLKTMTRYLKTALQ